MSTKEDHVCDFQPPAEDADAPFYLYECSICAERPGAKDL